MKYSIFLLAGRDGKRRKLMEILDPEEKYKSKALLPFLGKPLISWEIETFLQSKHVEKIIILGLEEKDLPYRDKVYYLPTEPNSLISQKLEVALDYLETKEEKREPVIICTSDCPGISVESLDT
ncbi:MAG: hypothetical protein ACTSRO_12465, partial [Candidatus Heimdallarchaeaceae archaeon]